MSIRDVIGSTIREKREQQGLSRENVCRDEESLTVRQLLRIENGQSLPSLEKLEYIASVLNVPISDLLGEQTIDIPAEYLEMKHRLIKFPTYANEEKLKQKLDLIDDVYNTYFEQLPEEELLFLDLLETFLTSINEERLASVEEIYEDAFKQALGRKTLNINDLLVFDYYLLGAWKDKYYDKVAFKKVERKLLNQSTDLADSLYNTSLIASIFHILGVYDIHTDYKEVLPAVNRAYEVIQEGQLFTYKPNIMVMEAKYYLYVKKDRGRAKELYHQAILVAESIGNDILVGALKEEQEKDAL